MRFRHRKLAGTHHQEFTDDCHAFSLINDDAQRTLHRLPFDLEFESLDFIGRPC